MEASFDSSVVYKLTDVFNGCDLSTTITLNLKAMVSLFGFNIGFSWYNTRITASCCNIANKIFDSILTFNNYWYDSCVWIQDNQLSFNQANEIVKLF